MRDFWNFGRRSLTLLFGTCLPALGLNAGWSSTSKGPPWERFGGIRRLFSHLYWIDRNHYVFSGKSAMPDLFLPKVFGQVDAMEAHLQRRLHPLFRQVWKSQCTGCLRLLARLNSIQMALIRMVLPLVVD